MSKNNSINFWRFVFTISIVVFHFSVTYEEFNIKLGTEENGNGWRLAVEFFFIVSGFLMAHKCENSELTAWEYTKHRFKRFFPAFFLMTVVMAVFWIIELELKGEEMWIYILNLSDELLLMQGTALNYVNNNGPAWYISSLIICGYFLFWLLRRYKEKFAHFGAPLICLIVYSYMNKDFGCLCGNITEFTKTTGISIALLRGFGGISAGILSYELYKHLKKIELTKFGTAVARIGEYAGFIIMLWYTFFYGSTQMDFIFLMFFVICTALAFSREKKNPVLNNKIVDYLAKISFSIYLTHIFVLRIFEYHFYSQEDYGERMLLKYVLISIASGAVCEFISSNAAKLLGKLSKKTGGVFIKRTTEEKAG